MGELLLTWPITGNRHAFPRLGKVSINAALPVILVSADSQRVGYYCLGQGSGRSFDPDHRVDCESSVTNTHEIASFDGVPRHRRTALQRNAILAHRNYGYRELRQLSEWTISEPRQQAHDK